MLRLQSSIVRIQAWWRKELTLKRLRAETNQMKASLANRGSMSSEQAAIKEFAT